MRDMLVTAIYMAVVIVLFVRVVRPRLVLEMELLNQVLDELNAALTALPAH